MGLSKEEVEDLIKQKLSSLEAEESRNKTEDLGFPLLHKVFISKFGKNLEKKCADLIEFTELSMLIISIVRKRNKIEKYYRKILDEGLRMSLEEDEESESRRIAEAIEPIKSFIFSNDTSNLDKKETDVLSKKGIQKLKIVERCSAYYIFALYAYIDVYLKELFENYFKKKISEQERDLLKSFPERGGVKERMKRLLQIIRKDLPEQIVEFYNNYNGLNDKLAFELLLVTRHDIAHANPLPKLEKLRSKFRKQYNKAKEKRDFLIEGFLGYKFFENGDENEENLISSKMKKTITNFFSDILKDIHLSFFFMEIGLSCIRYLAIIEAVTRKKYNI